MASTCQKGHEDLPSSFDRLPESQGGKGRHKCAACAYEAGRSEATQAEERLRKRVRELDARVKELEAKLKAR
ncbi:MAG TPA: hypothetical protein VFE90_07800 [Myxococcales bacterium]|jgi:hypothetical protein|nr:hypothetical protein [Myxococcales bacterium]